MQPMAPMSHGNMAPQYAYVNMPPGMMAYPGMPYQQAGYYYAANTGAYAPYCVGCSRVEEARNSLRLR
jgi:hypothetical protein